MESAQDHVFRLPELLELVLLHLPQKDLLLSQRVSRRFRFTVRDSPRLQRRLFFMPDWRLAQAPPNAHSTYNPTNNRLILRAFPGCYPTVSLIIASTEDRPQLSTTSTTQSIFRRSEHRSWDVCIAFPARHKPVRDPSVDYPEASWRRMYLCQPPCQKLYLVRRWQRSPSPAIVRECGITMGDFYNEATQSRRHDDSDDWNSSYIGFDRDWHFEGNIKYG